MSVPRFVAGFDSSSGMMLATAAYLRGEPFPALGHPPAVQPLIKATRLLPRRLREAAFIAGGAVDTISRRRAGRVDAETISRWVCDEYPRRRYPAVAIGSAGGALVHLCAALDMPWLPQTFLIPVRQPVHPDDPTGALIKGIAPGRALLARNPELQLHHMHDANQDRLMVRALTYLRVKRRVLGAAYERFLAERLEPGGTILISECARTWPTTAVGPRHIFQHGALGGATEEEFHRGSPRVAEYLARYDSPVRRWDGPQPDSISPEAEWGFAPALREDIERFAGRHGYQVRRMVLDEPDSLSPLVADLYRWWYQRRRIPASRLFVESFLIIEPHWALRTGSVPFWMTFNAEGSLAAIEKYLDTREPFAEIMLALFQNGVEAVGMPTTDQWRRVLARARGTGSFAGMRPEDRPRDLAHLAAYDDALRRIPARYPLPGPLTLGQFDSFLAEADNYPGVGWEELRPRPPAAARQPAMVR